MKEKLPWSLLIVSLVFIGYLLFTQNNLKTAYVTNAKLYTEFQLSKELNTKIQEIQMSRQNILDSLGLKINQLEASLRGKEITNLEEQKYQNLRREYDLKQQQFVEDNQMLNQKYQEQIAVQLNQYLKEYTEESGYDYIFGATGGGSLMGAGERYDITQDVIIYVNNRYKGISK